eukprot:gnl/Trimastix_PCT/1889.p1 GENE.gnl/Trimastix_PCT/1889~~gnl/Trimastix_PCT/1889.p1  ORF type:complete len:328 (+),score=42.15 gnl/Trimastix_PCT/1889:48-1031(+)
MINLQKQKALKQAERKRMAELQEQSKRKRGRDEDVSSIVHRFSSRKQLSRLKDVLQAPNSFTYSHKCILKDLTTIEDDIPPNCRILFSESGDIHRFRAHISPITGFWRGGTFEFSFEIPPTYRMEPPLVKCTTPVYHPNIDREGNVCLSILRESWTPVMNIQACILGLVFLFAEPNAEDPLNKEAGQHLRRSVDNFRNLVRRTMRGGYVDGIHYPRFPNEPPEYAMQALHPKPADVSASQAHAHSAPVGPGAAARREGSTQVHALSQHPAASFPLASPSGGTGTVNPFAVMGAWGRPAACGTSYGRAPVSVPLAPNGHHPPVLRDSR